MWTQSKSENETKTYKKKQKIQTKKKTNKIPPTKLLEFSFSCYLDDFLWLFMRSDFIAFFQLIVHALLNIGKCWTYVGQRHSFQSYFIFMCNSCVLK